MKWMKKSLKARKVLPQKSVVQSAATQRIEQRKRIFRLPTTPGQPNTANKLLKQISWPFHRQESDASGSLSPLSSQHSSSSGRTLKIGTEAVDLDLDLESGLCTLQTCDEKVETKRKIREVNLQKEKAPVIGNLLDGRMASSPENSDSYLPNSITP